MNCTYMSCALCTKLCRPIRLQIANHTYEYNSISHAKVVKWLLLLASKVGPQAIKCAAFIKCAALESAKKLGYQILKPHQEEAIAEFVSGKMC